jgi:hypothetical protein
MVSLAIVVAEVIWSLKNAIAIPTSGKNYATLENKGVYPKRDRIPQWLFFTAYQRLPKFTQNAQGL